MPDSARRAALRAARLAIVTGLVVGGLLASAASAAAYVPEKELDNATAAGQRPARETKPVIKVPATRGFDVSYPQCDSAYPRNPAFGIVGVNGGKVFTVNPCLASEIAWGGGARAELYINTGNPGPVLSSFWPAGQATPRICDASAPDTADCAFDYGWNAAKHSFETAQAAYVQLGITTSPSATTWWLDVETTNTWRTDAALNTAALEGEVAYLRDVAGVTKLGFYSTTVQWGAITGGTQLFATSPSWGAGAPTEKVARQHCVATPGFTGGDLALVQYPFQGFDANVRC